MIHREGAKEEPFNALAVSQAGIGVQEVLTSPYSATRAAQLAIVQMLTVELGPSNIRVSAICPSATLAEAIPAPRPVVATLQGPSLRSQWQQRDQQGHRRPHQRG